MSRQSALIFGPHVNKYHVSKSSSITKHIIGAIETAKADVGVTVSAAQVFVANPRNGSGMISQADQDELREYIDLSGLQLVIHHVYSHQPWDGDEESITQVNAELGVCKTVGADGLVLHLPKSKSVVVDILRRLEIPAGVSIYLETPALSKANSIYHNVSTLNEMFALIQDPRIGLCIDTAHLWTNGLADVAQYNTMKSWINEIDLTIIPRIMFHLNDSEKALGCGPDTHAPLGNGMIWKKMSPTETGCAAVVDFAKRHGFPVIVERDAKELLPDDYRYIMSC